MDAALAGLEARAAEAESRMAALESRLASGACCGAVGGSRCALHRCAARPPAQAR
jgi:hypothetical protein